MEDPGAERAYVRRCLREQQGQLKHCRQRRLKARQEASLKRRSRSHGFDVKREKRIRNRKKTAAPSHESFDDEAVKKRHGEIVEQMQMSLHDPEQHDKDFLQHYLVNYANWENAKRVELVKAMAETERELELHRENELRNQADRRLRQHQKALRPSLKLLDPAFRPAPRPVAKGATLHAFFNKKPTDHTKTTERLFNKFYFSNVAICSSRLHSFPEFKTDAGSSDDASHGAGLKCRTCGGPCIKNMQEGMLVCTRCGVSVQGGDGVGFKQTFQEASASSRFGAPYNRETHFKDFLANLEGMEKTNVPDKVLHDLYVYCKTLRINPRKTPERITYQWLRRALSAVKYAAYFENIPQIRYQLTKQEPPRFTAQQKDQLLKIFREIQKPFEKHKGPTRKNFLNYSVSRVRVKRQKKDQAKRKHRKGVEPN